MRRGLLEPGHRDRVITIQRLTASTAGSGMPIETWTTLVSGMPASKDDKRGNERFAANQQKSVVDSVFTINYRADMDPDLVDVPTKRRIVFSGRVFDIVHATQIGRRDGLALETVASSRLSS